MERFLNAFGFGLTTKGKYLRTKEKLVLLFYLVIAVRCSSVISKSSQRGIHVSSYCPKMEYCDEGTHVMCMYYNPDTIMGPNCGDGQNITVTPELVELMLDIVNQIRSTVAKGEETGKNGQLLPKAYGMVRLRWDRELATFAQIWANQCTVRHDLCRATKRFPNPAQLVSLVRFTYPDWKLVSDNTSMSNKNDGLTMSKLKHTITTTMKISYVRKNQVTREMIENFPDLSNSPHLASVRVFMTMIHTGSTHMGCGISAYADYYGKTHSQSVIVNSVQVVCNFSAQPQAGTRVFDMKPAPGSSPRCGCPPDTREDEDCLCIPRNHRDPDEDIRSCSKDDPGCTPPMILLPIFKVEDAPPEKLYNPRLGNNSYLREGSIEAVSIYRSPEANFFNGQLRSERLQPLQLSNLKLPTSISKLGRRIGDYESRRFRDVRNRYFDKQFFIPGQRYRNGGSLIRDDGHVPRNGVHPPLRKDSIFTRASKFKLPLQNKHVDHSIPMDNLFAIKKRSAIKKDVKPRKDFSNIKSLASRYLSNKNHANHSIPYPVHDLIDAVDTITPKFGIAGFNISKRNFEIKHSNEEPDNKLLTLLDNLEEEVKHIELNNNIKEMVDEKIRKIYGNVVGNPNVLLKPKRTEMVEELIQNIKSKTGKKHEILPKYAGMYVPEVELATPQTRHQNSMTQYDNSILEQYSDRRGMFDRNDKDSFGNLDVRYYKYGDGRRNGHKHFDNIKKDYYFDNDDDPLGAERRKYYQQKLDNIERKLKSIRGYSRRNEKQDQGLLYRPLISRTGLKPARYSNRVDDFYMPDRAKFLHGF